MFQFLKVGLTYSYYIFVTNLKGLIGGKIVEERLYFDEHSATTMCRSILIFILFCLN